MLTSTSDSVPGYRIARTIGVTYGVSARSTGVGGWFTSFFRSIIGGESKAYVKLMDDARIHALDRLVESANQLGANAVLTIRYDSSEMGRQATEIVAYGTAVVLEGMGPEGYAPVQTATPQPAVTPRPASPPLEKEEPPKPPPSRFY